MLLRLTPSHDWYSIHGFRIHQNIVNENNDNLSRYGLHKQFIKSMETAGALVNLNDMIINSKSPYLVLNAILEILYEFIFIRVLLCRHCDDVRTKE